MGVEVDDLHAVIANGPAGLQLPKNVHFTPAGYQLLAKSVAASVFGSLPH
jgi:acyl-CoA thioesterase-1